MVWSQVNFNFDLNSNSWVLNGVKTERFELFFDLQRWNDKRDNSFEDRAQQIGTQHQTTKNVWAKTLNYRHKKSLKYFRPLYYTGDQTKSNADQTGVE